MTDQPPLRRQKMVFDEQPEVVDDVAEQIKSLQDKMVFGADEPVQFDVAVVDSSENDFALEQVQLEKVLVPKKSRWSLAKKLLLTTVAAIVSIETAQFFIQVWSEQPIIASLYSTAFVLALGLAGKVGIAEYRQLKQLKKLQHWHQDAERMDKAEQIGEALSLCNTINKTLPTELKPAVQQWRESLQESFTDKEVLTLYSEMVLNKADDKSLKVISKYATETALMVAISPLAVMDMALVLWRSIRMIDDICQQYGVKLGYWSRIKLIKTVMQNVLYAGVSELIADVGAAALSLELAGKLSARAAQGLGAGLLTGRLGFKVMQLCRPVPALPNKQKRLGDLSKQLLGNLRRGLTNKPQDPQ